MAISTKPGFIYFLREIDTRTGEMTPYVKIGITRGTRAVEKRIDEHKTSNPREIHDYRSFQVTAIDTVETHLHHTFAEHRVEGEWFYLDKDTLDAAIKEAERISLKIDEHKTALQTADEANEKVSIEPEREATKEEMELLNKVIKAGELLKPAKQKEQLIKTKLLAKMGASKGIDEIVQIQERKSSPTIDKKSLREAHPDIYAQYVVEKEKLKRPFSLAKRPRSLEKLDPDLDATIKELNSTEGESDERVFNDPPKERTSLLEDLHLEYLSAMKSTSEAELEKILFEAQIKAACGRAKGISDVCAWSREWTTGEEFDTPRFKKEHEELARQFTKPGALKLVPIIYPRRSYPVGR